jgi:hypothetical protein
MSRLVNFDRHRVFSLNEAQSILPVIYKITDCQNQKVQALVNRWDLLQDQSEALLRSFEEQVDQEILEWKNKLQRLGVFPKGMWLADFDSGDGLFCWKFPETIISHWHHYHDGFSKRIKIHERIGHEIDQNVENISQIERCVGESSGFSMTNFDFSVPTYSKIETHLVPSFQSKQGLNSQPCLQIVHPRV